MQVAQNRNRNAELNEAPSACGESILAVNSIPEFGSGCGSSSSSTRSLPAAATFPALCLHQVVPNSTGMRACPSSIPPPRISRRTLRARVKASLLFRFCFYLQRRVCQRAALQARFRSRTSPSLIQVLTLCSESTVRRPLHTFQPDIIMRL